MIANTRTNPVLPNRRPVGTESPLGRASLLGLVGGEPELSLADASKLHGVRRDPQRWHLSADDHRTVGLRWSNCKASPFHLGSRSAQP